MAKTKKKQVQHSKDEGFFEYYAKDNEAFIGAIVLSVIIMAAAGFFIYLIDGAHALYSDAPYKAEADAVLVNVDKYEKEQEVLDDYYKDLPSAERVKHTKVEKYTLYVLDWEYELDGKTYHIEESDKYLSGHKVGDKKTFKVYSYDGIEYKKSPENGITDVLLGLCRIAEVLLAVFLIGIVIAKIKYLSRGRKARGGK